VTTLSQWVVENVKARPRNTRSPIEVAQMLPKIAELMAEMAPHADWRSAASYLTGVDPGAIDSYEGWKEIDRATYVIVITLDSGQDLEFEIPDVELMNCPRSELAALGVLFGRPR
jgi:hypothetical protein